LQLAEEGHGSSVARVSLKTPPTKSTSGGIITYPEAVKQRLQKGPSPVINALLDGVTWVLKPVKKVTEFCTWGGASCKTAAKRDLGL